jgi:hypothetical protein
MGTTVPEEHHHDERGEAEDLRGTRRAVPRALRRALRGGWGAHRVVTVKEVTRSNVRPAFEAVADIILELG